MFRGTVVSIQTTPKRALPMQQHREVDAVAGKGLEGDRYFLGPGASFESLDVSREITLIESEAIEALHEKGIALEPGDARRNVVTQGVPLNHLVGRTFLVGKVRLRGTRLCEPCSHLEAMTQKGVLKELIHRGGLRADIVSGGVIHVGDTVKEDG